MNVMYIVDYTSCKLPPVTREYFCCCFSAKFFYSFVFFYESVLPLIAACNAERLREQRKFMCMCALTTVLLDAYVVFDLFVCMVNIKWSDKDEMAVSQRRKTATTDTKQHRLHEKKNKTKRFMCTKNCRWLLCLWASRLWFILAQNSTTASTDYTIRTTLNH